VSSVLVARDGQVACQTALGTMIELRLGLGAAGPAQPASPATWIAPLGPRLCLPGCTRISKRDSVEYSVGARSMAQVAQTHLDDCNGGYHDLIDATRPFGSGCWITRSKDGFHPRLLVEAASQLSIGRADKRCRPFVEGKRDRDIFFMRVAFI